MAQPAGKRLKGWLDAHGHDVAWLARELGVGRSVAWRWCHSGRMPRGDFMVAIERLTGGVVAASLWKPPAKKAA